MTRVRLARVASCGLVALTSTLVAPAIASAFDFAPLCVARWTVESICECTPDEADPSNELRSAPPDTLLPMALRLQAAGDLEGARRVLREAGERFPRVADRLWLLEARIAVEEGALDEAIELFELARRSPSPEIRILARVGSVTAMLGADDVRGPRALRAVLDEYPELPEALELELAYGRSLERTGHGGEAAVIYRRIDLEHPGLALAASARESLAALASRGVSVPPLTREERMRRVERLVRTGPTADAQSELDLLLAEENLSGADRETVLRLSARVARLEARFDDVARLEAALGVSSRNVPRVVATPEERRAKALAEFRALARGRTALRVREAHLVAAARIAVRAGLVDELESVMTRAATGTFSSASRFHVAMVASGTPADDGVLRVLGTLTSLGGAIGEGGRYHYARTLERLGREDDANAAFARISTNDAYYAMWAEQRAHRIAHRGAVAESVEDVGASDGPRAKPSGVSLALGGGPGRTNFAPYADRLTDVATRLAETYPWLGRAEDMLRLGDREAAASELYDVLVAHRAASGRGLHRAGLDAVARGRDAARRAAAGLATGRHRAPLPGADRDAVATLAKDLGEWGTAIAFGGAYEADAYPRPYEAEVEAAARRHGIDPDLVYAVMRVESVYQPHIVSYAGAIGLLQIMPRTGRLIARQLGRGDFTERELLDARTNVEFGAYYLASLSRRFEGRIPLAIAAYNGGPHNVRTWMSDNGRNMPLDAFLERIPFDQTFRYVRRVLSHYAAYRAKRGLPMVDLDVTLPPMARDPLGF